MIKKQMNRPVIMRGSCQCGAVRYELYATPTKAHLCHCRMCQKAVGGPYAALAPVLITDLEWTGKREPTTYKSSSTATRGYCADCGTPISFQHNDSEWIDVTIGSLDDPNLVPPELHYGVESMLDWVEDLADLPRHQTQQGGITGQSK